jgi:hypothetical protein
MRRDEEESRQLVNNKRSKAQKEAEYIENDYIGEKE